MFNLNGKRALVCGATKGIGRASAIMLSQAGAEVVAVARNSESLSQLCNELNASGGKTQFVSLDLSNTEEINDKISKLLQNQKIDILVNNAGGPPGGKLLDANFEQFDEAFAPHLKAIHQLVQLIVPSMIENKFGRIINIISTSVKAPILGLGVSNTVRGAVASYSKTLAGELGQYGITVNNVLPGFTATERLENLIKAKSNASGKSIGEIEAEMMSEVPVKRFAKAEEVAAAVLFLASNEAAYINGINIPVDGGRTQSL